MREEEVWFSHREKKWVVKDGKFSWTDTKEIWDWDNCTVDFAKTLKDELVVVVRSKTDANSTYLGKYLFNWNDVPGKEDNLITSFKADPDINWISHASIIKTENGRTIQIFTEEKSAQITLGENNETAILKIDGILKQELQVKKENGDLKIYSGKPVELRFMLGFEACKISEPIVECYTARKNIPEKKEGPKKRWVFRIEDDYWIWAWAKEGIDIKSSDVYELYKLINERITSPSDGNNIFKVELEDEDNRHLFDWDDIPGNRDNKLIELIRDHIPELLPTARIKKTDNTTIDITDGKNRASLKLNDEKTRAIMTVNDVVTDDFNVKNENARLKIFENRIIPVIYQPSVDTLGNFLREVHCAKRIQGNDGPVEVEVTLIFNNEQLRKHSLVDKIYEKIRWLRYGRTRDIESFTIIVRNDAKENAFVFEDIYSDYHRLEDDTIHGDRPPAPERRIKYYFNSYNHPIVFVNTSNHAMAGHDSNHDIWKWEYIPWVKNAPVKLGSKTRDEINGEFKPIIKF
ncbi:Uncharacterised protein [uncultured archaeon]|nr:Uncharacterised protein [uncultured archaeon]